ncbi:MAG TPA: Smr/MutS family protein, partial [Thermoanaerobaculia bacterium]|nr:Smr/MutS family protein [Thermoanaerobaculia bacterium]
GVLELAGRFSATERGRDVLLKSRPESDRAAVERNLGVTADLVTRRSLRPPIVLGGLDEGAALLPRLGPKGRALPPEELLDLFVLLERIEGARGAVPLPEVELPHLTPLLSPLGDFSDLLEERSITFEPDGRVKDTASARLAAIRSSIVRLRKDVVTRLTEFARSRPEALGDTFVTEKGGRYCLPVRSDRRDSVAGIVHEKSGSGQTLFVEPLAVVDANNALAEALEEEREEIHRILMAITERFTARRADLLFAVGILAALDAAQARAEFAQRTQGIVPAFGPALVLKGARHPLLDRRLAPLRQEVFGEDLEARHSEAVPLDLELPDGKRLVVLSGPNAGGKSVAMKTVGLFALLAQSGFTVPADPGTTLPVFDRILVVAGDAQDLLGDLSSFAASMTRTARVLLSATSKSLVLLDELGSGTDPDEGSALAISILEEDRRRGGFTVATTHLNAVKEWAHGQGDVVSAAMEFDDRLGRPTFHVKVGATGRSRALAVAEKAGVPPAVVEAAKKRLGGHWAAADAALERLERETQEARAASARAREAAAKAEERLTSLEVERSALSAERARLRDKARQEIDRALEAMREKTRRELERLREEMRAGRAVSRGALTTITHAAREEALAQIPEPAPEASGPVAVGDMVRVAPFRATGRLLALNEEKGEAEVEVGGKRMRVSRSALAPVGSTPKAPTVATRVETKAGTSRSEVVLIGQRVDDALPEVERALNDALLSGRGSLRIVHGFGTGRLAAAVREFLAEHPGVTRHRPGDDKEGGNAVTIAELGE